MAATQPLENPDVRAGAVGGVVVHGHVLAVPGQLVGLQRGSRKQQGVRAGDGEQPLPGAVLRPGLVGGVADPLPEVAVPPRGAPGADVLPVRALVGLGAGLLPRNALLTVIG